jgi:two-component system, cell cycle response regulator
VARILVIEDNPINLELMTYLLRAWGHEALTASDGEAGIALARSGRPDLVVCDIQMPGMDGYAVARVLKSDPELARLPLIAVTAFAMVGDRDQALQAGFDTHVAKPIDPKAFMVELARFLPGTAAPAQPQESRAPERTPGLASIAPQLRAASPGLTILLADDTEANLDFKHSLLEPAGYRVLAAACGADALALARAEPVDLILSDVMMPAGDGFELLAQVRADPALRDLPFLFLTSTARDSVSRARGLALGADAYLLRPIEPEALLAELRARLPQRRTPG